MLDVSGWNKLKVVSALPPSLQLLMIGNTTILRTVPTIMAGLAIGSRLTRKAIVEPYICPSCLLKGAFVPRIALPRRVSSQRNHSVQPRPRPANTNHDRSFPRPSSHLKRRQRAPYASLASTTAINRPSTIPPEYADLHQKLLTFQEAASSYVDLSRLQLAARSLESTTPTIRVAFLGLGTNGAHAARNLARVVLSDLLADETAAWERSLLDSGADGRSLLLRYGDEEEVVQSSPLIHTIHIPSPLLKRANVEILVTTLNADNVGQMTRDGLEDAVLVPSLTTPTSAGGRVGFVRYPVHKALIVAEGITGAVQFGRLSDAVAENELIDVALSLPLRSSTGTKSAEETITGSSVDIDLATHALELFRTDRANGARFSKEWQTSRITTVTDWITGPAIAEGELRPAVRNLLDSIFATTSAKIEAVESDYHKLSAQSTVQAPKREEITQAVSAWSANAHRDLQLNLSTAFHSPPWRRTAWFRLLWRIDDVSVSAGDILRMAWLTEAEQSLAFLSGRIQEASLATSAELKDATSLTQVWVGKDPGANMDEHRKSVAGVGELWQQPLLIERVRNDSGIDVAFDPPWPQTIHHSRQQMLHTLIPAFHRKAQALLLSTLSTVGATTALGAWLFIATQGIAIYEAGAIASLGLVWSLRRLQKLWGKEREGLALTLQEDGRRVLAEVEAHLIKIVREGGKVNVLAEDEEGVRVAQAAMAECRQALADVVRRK